MHTHNAAATGGGPTMGGWIKVVKQIQCDGVDATLDCVGEAVLAIVDKAGHQWCVLFNRLVTSERS